MIPKQHFILILIAASLFGLGSIHMGQAAHPTEIEGGGSPADYPWQLATLHTSTGGDFGQHNAIAFSPSTTKPYISYYNAIAKDLRLIYPVESNGNCGPDNGWYCETVDSQGDVGQYSSIDYFSQAGTNKIGIAYFDATNHALKAAIWSCPTFLPCGWSISMIEQGTIGVSNFGRYASLKFDALGAAHITYYNENSFINDSLKYASYVGSGGNCGIGSATGKWLCETVVSGANTGAHSSLDLTSNDAPYIAFTVTSSNEVRVCNRTGTSWACATIDNASYGFPSLVLDQSNHAHIAYYDGNNGMLKYAHYIGSGGNCGLNAYQCDNIKAIGTGLSQVGLSLDMYMNQPMIAYQNSSDPLGFSTLDIARLLSDYPGKTAGNCGPVVGIIPQWQCDTLDNADQGGGGGNLYEADYVAAAIDPTGLAMIAYYEYDDYHTEGRLKIAYQERLEKIYLPLIIK